MQVGAAPELRVTASFGPAVMPKHGETLSELLDAADQALYTAKRSGRRNRVLVA